MVMFLRVKGEVERMFCETVVVLRERLFGVCLDIQSGRLAVDAHECNPALDDLQSSVDFLDPLLPHFHGYIASYCTMSRPELVAPPEIVGLLQPIRSSTLR